MKKVFSNYALFLRYKQIYKDCAVKQKFLHRKFKGYLQKTVLLHFLHKTVLETVPKAVSSLKTFYKTIFKGHLDFSSEIAYFAKIGHKTMKIL